MVINSHDCMSSRKKSADYRWVSCNLHGQVCHGSRVRRIHEILNHPSDDILGIIFDRGSIHGCPYTSRDVRIMRKIYGPSVSRA